MDEWEKFNETSMAKEQSYSNLNMEDITDANYMHAKTVWKDFQIKNLSEYHNFFLKNETLLLADVFKNLKKNVFRNLSARHWKNFFQLQVSIASNFKNDWSRIRNFNWFWYAVNSWKRS